MLRRRLETIREGAMDTRASIEAILDKAYEARRSEDVEAVIACFHEDGRFLSNGAPAATRTRVEQRTAIKDLFDAFALLEFEQHCRVIDPRGPRCTGAAN